MRKRQQELNIERRFEHETPQKKKAASLMVHAQRRVLDRYGCWLGKRAIKELAAMCRRGEFFCHLGRQSLTRSKIVVKQNGRLFPLIYDKKRHCVITVLTMDMLSADEQAMVAEAEYSA